MLDSVKWLRVELGDCEQSSDPRGILLKIGGGGGVPPRYPNPDPISDQKMFFFAQSRYQTRLLQSIPVFTPASKKLCLHF